MAEALLAISLSRDAQQILEVFESSFNLNAFISTEKSEHCPELIQYWEISSIFYQCFLFSFRPMKDFLNLLLFSSY